MADTVTLNLGLVMPEVGASDDTWGGKQNDAFALIDKVFNNDPTGTPVSLTVGPGKKLFGKDGTAEFTDARFTLVDEADPTKVLRFELSGIPTATTVVLKVPPASSDLVTLDATQTLTNKTLTTPTIAGIENSGLLVLPDGPDTIVGRTSVDTLTNKTLDNPTIISPDLTDAVSDTFTANSYRVTAANIISVPGDIILTAAHNGLTLVMNATTSAKVKVPSGLPVGFGCTVVQGSTGPIAFENIGAAVNSRLGLKLAGQWSVAGLIGMIADVYVAGGDLTS